VLRRVVIAAAAAATAAGLAGLDPAAAGVFTIVALGVLLTAACALGAALVPATIAAGSAPSRARSHLIRLPQPDRSGVLSVMRR